jgi:RimJ/RimL family protein N-acetyltransferase
MAQAVQGSMEHLDRWVRVGPRLATELLASQEIRRVTAEWWADTNYVLGVFDEGGSVVGGTGFHPRGGALGTVTTEIGMWITASHSGRGLATEVLQAMLHWGFTAWPWERIEWRCEAGNVASAAVAKKAGMVLDGVLRSSTVDQGGRRCDIQVFSKLRTERS